MPAVTVFLGGRTMKQMWVYIVASPSRTIYVGVTSNLERRVWEHRTGAFDGFTKKYGCTRLVYCEEYARADEAIAREKEIKAWRREKKLALIAKDNPRWFDLSRDWDI
jgi:putative endonuclease